MTTIHTSDKDEIDLINWLQSACSKDKFRPILTGLYITENETVATDGKKLFIAPTPEILKPFIGKIIKLSSELSINKLIGVEEIDGNYPDYQALFSQKEPIFEIAVSADDVKTCLELAAKNKELIDKKALFRFIDKKVLLRFYADDRLFAMVYKDTKALNMLMDKDK